MNKQELEETLVKVEREPGLCNMAQLLCAQEFYRSLDKKLKVYAEVHNQDPFGGTIEAKLTTVQWYMNNFKGGK